MSNELFVELNDEQQEVVTGGLAALTLLNASFFSSDTVVGSSFSVSGPGGAQAGSSGGAQSIDSGSFSFLGAIAD
jgi:hypothetical protein